MFIDIKQKQKTLTFLLAFREDFKLEVHSSTPFSSLHTHMMGMKHLESLGMADSVRLCSSWVLHQQQSRLGTTFPPLATHLACAHIMVASQEASSSRCLSEPNLAKYSEFGDPIILGEEGEEEDFINCGQKEEDEDHLFELDLDSHGSSDNGDEDEEENIFGEHEQDENEEDAFPVQVLFTFGRFHPLPMIICRQQ